MASLFGRPLLQMFVSSFAQLKRAISSGVALSRFSSAHVKGSKCPAVLGEGEKLLEGLDSMVDELVG